MAALLEDRKGPLRSPSRGILTNEEQIQSTNIFTELFKTSEFFTWTVDPLKLSLLLRSCPYYQVVVTIIR